MATSTEGVLGLLESIGVSLKERLKLNDALGQEDVQVTVELFCAKKNSEGEAGKVMSALGSALRDSDDTNFEVTLANGQRIRGKDMKVESLPRIECVDRFPTPDSIFTAMREWYMTLVETQVIVDVERLGNSR